MAKIAPSPNLQHLPKFVGYREVQESLGVSRRTVERMVREGRFPRPVHLAPNRVGWQVETITAWLSERSQGLVAQAVAQAADLEPDQLEKQAVELVVKSIELRTGEPFDPGDLGIQVTRCISEDEFRVAERREFTLYSERFAHFDRMRACVMAAWLFKCLRPVIQQSVPAAQRQIYRDAATLARFGEAALHDEAWTEIEAQYRRILESSVN